MTAPDGAVKAGSGLRRAGPLAVAGAVANGISVVVTVGVARLLTEREYGAMSQLVGLYLVLSTPGSALLIAVVRRATALEAGGRRREIAPWVAGIRRTGAFALAGWTVVAVGSRWWAARELGLPSPSGVAEVLVAGGAWALLSIERGLLQARQAYGTLAANLGVEAAARAVVTLVIVGLGGGVEGAALGLLGAVAVAAAHARWALHRLDRERAADPPDHATAAPPAIPVEAGRRGMAVDLAAAVAALALLASLQSVDVVVVGRRAPGEAGAYAAISVACKALVFLAIALAGYLLPEAVARFHKGEHALRQLAVAGGLVAVPAAGLLLVALVVPKLLLRVFFGPDLTDAAPAFATLALAMACLAGSVLCTNYLLGIGRRIVTAVLAVALGLVGGLVVAADGKPVGTARAELAGQAVLLAALVALAVTAHRSSTGMTGAAEGAR